MTRVLVVDDHPMMLMLLAAYARTAFSSTRVETARGLPEAIEAARAMGGVDACLLDLGLPGCKGIEALTRFRHAFAQARVVIVSANEERAVVLAALAEGASGYIPKSSEPKVVQNALRLVAGGGRYVPPQAIEACANPPEDIGLTCRQLEVLRLIARGLPNKEIAHQLSIAKDTVKQHAKAVYALLGVKTRTQAGRAAQIRGIKID
jgi:DNA-binding NarL/FixJ family response regulator